MIYWVEDEEDIRDCISEMIEFEYPNLSKHLIFLPHWSELPIVNDEDVIVHDLIGIGQKPENLNKIVTYICSGSTDEKYYEKINIRKPFQIKDIYELLKKHI